MNANLKEAATGDQVMATYKCDDGYAEIEITADSARAAAQEYVDGGDWGDAEGTTTWVTVYVQQVTWQVLQMGDVASTHDDESDADDAASELNEEASKPNDEGDTTEVGDGTAEVVRVEGERASYSIEIPATEPDCVDGDHDWQSPHWLVGGISENPGVWGHGGGVIMQEVCMRCGCGRVTDTWAQDRATGEQGLRSVEYQRGKYASEVDTANTLGSD